MSDEREGLSSTSGFDSELRCLRQRTRVQELDLVKKTNEAMESGTRVHSHLEGNKEELSEDEEDAARSIYNNKSKLCKELGFLECEEVREERLWRTHVFGDKLWSSKIDLQCLKADAALVIDYKTGFTELVDASTSYQILGEMIVTYDKTKLPVIYGALVRRFHYDYIKLTAQELEVKGNEIDSLVKQSLDPSSPYSPGYIQCIYCPVRKAGKCPAQSNAIAASTGLDIDHGKLDSMSSTQRRELMDKAKIAKKKLDELDDVLEDYARRGLVEGVSFKDASRRSLTCDVADIHKEFPEIGVDALLKGASITMDAIDKLKISKRMEELGLIKKIQYSKLVRK